MKRRPYAASPSLDSFCRVLTNLTSTHKSMGAATQTRLLLTVTARVPKPYTTSPRSTDISDATPLKASALKSKIFCRTSKITQSTHLSRTTTSCIFWPQISQTTECPRLTTSSRRSKTSKVNCGWMISIHALYLWSSSTTMTTFCRMRV